MFSIKISCIQTEQEFFTFSSSDLEIVKMTSDQNHDTPLGLCVKQELQKCLNTKYIYRARLHSQMDKPGSIYPSSFVCLGNQKNNFHRLNSSTLYSYTIRRPQTTSEICATCGNIITQIFKRPPKLNRIPRVG